MNQLLPAETLRRWLDLFEQLAVISLYGWLVVRIWPETLSATILLLISEGLVCVLLIIRRPTLDISLNVKDWLVAAGGTFLPLLVIDDGEPVLGPAGGYLLLAGLLIHVGAKLSLLRSFGLVAANRGVKVRGMYSFVRHPMYAGYMLCHAGFLLVSPSMWNAAIYGAVWFCLVGRIIAEERILGEDPKYKEYASQVRYRLVPGIY